MEKSTSEILQSFAHSTVAQPEKFSHGWTEIIVFTLREARKESDPRLMASNSARLIVGDVQKDLRKEPELVEETNSVTNSGKN